MKNGSFFQFEIIISVLVSFFSADSLSTSESDVYRRQILTYKDGPRVDKVNVLIILSFLN